MGMNPDDGHIREMLPDEEPRGREVIFRKGELIDVRGCLFKIENIHPNPEDTLILKGVGLNQEEEVKKDGEDCANEVRQRDKGDGEV